MDKKFYVYHLKNTGLTKLLKIKFDCVIEIFGNSSDANCKLLLKPTGYYIVGDIIPQFEIYFDSTNNIFYLCTNGHDNISYVNIGVNIANDGFALSDYEDNFDVTNYTKLNPLNIDYAITKRQFQYTPTVTANTVVEYIAKTTYKQYMTQSSLILLSLRNSQDVGGSGLYLIHRKCAGTLADTPNFSVEPIYQDSVMSQFSITGTKSGLSFTNTSNFRYSITEISNGTN